MNGYPADALTRLLGEWGELETPWKIANCIVRAREAAPIETTAQLVEAVKPCTPKKDESKFLTKLFQALRIEVNGEMEALKMALEQSLKVLRPGGGWSSSRTTRSKTGWSRTSCAAGISQARWRKTFSDAPSRRSRS